MPSSEIALIHNIFALRVSSRTTRRRGTIVMDASRPLGV